MVRSEMLTVLVHILLLSHGAQSLEPEEGASLQAGALDLPWQDELCCDSPSAHLAAEGGDAHVTTETNRSESNLPLSPVCSFRGSANRSHPHESSGGSCLDILCRIDEDWEHLTCDLQPLFPSSPMVEAGPMAVSLQRVLSQTDDTRVKDGNTAADNPVVCEGTDSFMCSLALGSATNFVSVVTVSISSAIAPAVPLRIPDRPVKQRPPVNLSHIQTIKAELILRWDDPPDSDIGPLRYQVRHSPNPARPTWQVVSAHAEPRLSLELKARLNYTIQVRCSGLEDPPVWSDWSEPHHIYLHSVSYIPEKVVARPGDNVTVYCVFNDHGVNASTAAWTLNFKRLHRSLYRPVNQWVSQITVRPSETQMYDLLQCTREWTSTYNQIYVEGASVNINCVTNGDIDAMDCSWTNTQLTNPEFRSRWADLPCDVMEERNRAGETVGVMGPSCPQVHSKQETCSIRPLRMNCYKLWLEMPSLLGPVRTKPVYLSPIDHVKPHTPTNVKAVSRRGGVLMVTWEPPPLPAEGLQCQIRYRLPSAVRAQPEWQVQSLVRVPWMEVAVSDMCRVYMAQVRCMHTRGTGYWSEWSDVVYSTPQNSRAPDQGPDFWRVFQDEPHRNEINVTLLFKQLQIPDRSYCVDGFIFQYQARSGVVVRKHVDMASSYSFQWDQEPQTVTVEAYNNLGSSTNNINMTLERQPTRRFVRSFSVLVINSTCVSLSWSLLDDSSVPLFMVVQWSPQRQQVSDHHKGRSGDTWVRLPYTDSPVYLRGDFFGPEQSSFCLYAVFADGEGEPVYATTTRRDPGAYIMLLIISFLSIVLLVTLILSQNQMKKFVWKDVPNPNKCSWAKGLDFKKTDTFDHLFQPSEGLAAWQLLLPSEEISKVIVDKVHLSALTTALVQAPHVTITPDPPTVSSLPLPPGSYSEGNQAQVMENEELRDGALNLDALVRSNPRLDPLQLDDPPPEGLNDSSAQSSVTYATVLLSDLKKEQQHIDRHYKSGSGSNSSDEGNFSANNSDISDSFRGGMWALDSCRGGEMDDQRRSCSYNSVEELSQTPEQEDEEEEEEEEEKEEEEREEKDMYYLEMDYPAEDEESEEDEGQGEEETNIQLLHNVVLNREDRSVESHPLLGPEESMELLSVTMQDFSPLYLPQFRTALCARQLKAQDDKPLAQTAFK
ncbi:leptin receptor [Clinocottus analis]|uniref:leptin receptor n=1 Tax=Clinocottus analis TaxID=304258 RepID=UPI0035C11B73